MPGSSSVQHCTAISTTHNVLAEQRGSPQFAVPDWSQLRVSSVPALHRAVLGESITSPNQYNQISTALPEAASEHASAVLLKQMDSFQTWRWLRVCVLQLPADAEATQCRLGRPQELFHKREISFCSFSKGAACWHLPWGTA